MKIDLEIHFLNGDRQTKHFREWSYAAGVFDTLLEHALISPQEYDRLRAILRDERPAPALPFYARPGSNF